jgi:hypothetical protein
LNATFRRILWAAAAVVVGAAAGTVVLFSGSRVTCIEQSGDAGPALRCVFDVAADQQTVWAGFVATGDPRPYYFDAVLQADLHSGGHWRFVTDDLRRLLAGGEILVLEPPRRFAQTFAAADLDDAPSRITVELEAIPAGTSVVLVHDGFVAKTATYRRFRRAHPLALSAMKSWLETGKLPLRARIYTMLFKPGMKRVSARAEPWS